MKVSVKIFRNIEEDAIISKLWRVMRVSRLCGSFDIDVSDVFSFSPCKIGQYIRLKSSCTPILIDKNTRIIYDVESETWRIVLPTWYAVNFDALLLDTKERYGFDKIEVISK